MRKSIEIMFFKGYTAIIRIESELEIVYIIGFLKHNKLF